MRLKYLESRPRKDGSRRWYVVRRGRKPVRLPDLPHDHPDFLAAYAAALADTAPDVSGRSAPGSIAAVALAYKTSAAWRDLKPSSREQRDRELRRLVEAIGEHSIRAVSARHIRADLAKLTPGAAANRLKAWRALLRQAVEMELIATDPSSDVRAGARRGAGHAMWTTEAIAAYREKWDYGTEQRLALELGLWTGARRSDLVRIGWQHVGRDGWLTYRQTKTGGEVCIPLTAAPPAGMEDDHAHLQAAIAHTRGRMLFLQTRSGEARSDKAFSAWIGKACERAGVEGMTPHGWRKWRATDLGERLGWTPHQIMAWTGHTSLKEVEGYTRGANRRRLIEGANQRPQSVLPTPAKTPDKSSG